MPDTHSFQFGKAVVSVEQNCHHNEAQPLLLRFYKNPEAFGDELSNQAYGEVGLGKVIASFPMSRDELVGFTHRLVDISLKGLNPETFECPDEVYELQEITQAESAIDSVFKAFSMIERLDQRIPVLKSCQRAVKQCRNGNDLNELNSLAISMIRDRKLNSFPGDYRLNDDWPGGIGSESAILESENDHSDMEFGRLNSELDGSVILLESYEKELKLKRQTISMDLNEASPELLEMNIVDESRNPSENVQLSITVSRKEVFGLSCGMLCTILNTAPSGHFDLYPLPGGSTENASGENKEFTGESLLDRHEHDSEKRNQFSRHEMNTNVLWNCQRALEISKNEFDVSIMNAMSNLIKRNLPVDFLELVERPYVWADGEIGLAEESATYERRSVDEFGLRFIPEKVVEVCMGDRGGGERLSIKRWLAADSKFESSLCNILEMLNLSVAEFEGGFYQIRSDLVTPKRQFELCEFSPRLALPELEAFGHMAIPVYQSIFEQNKVLCESGEVPPISESVVFLKEEFHGEQVLH